MLRKNPINSRLFLVATVSSIVALGVVGEAQAASFTVYNTGAGVSPGAVDPHWQIISAPPGVSTGAGSAIELTSIPSPPWFANDSTSQWIGSAQSGFFATGPGGFYTYETKFDLTGLDPSTAVLKFFLASDDQTTNVALNGKSIISGSPSYLDNIGFQGFPAAPLTINREFVPGINTLRISLFTGAGTPTGLRVNFTEATAAATPVPEPSAVAGLPLLAMSAGWLLKKKMK
ncbi:PEP-CTERM sorting domain-containing protein [Microseira wollei]|uniref:PEP-CTERM sorting domain-containing protein n=1 Tax=Microseira wollei NIES-4236 TaxID=2530354 RepID=A0AAV3XJ65_9CYAN|nr:PEP-CTERM sorting domain-containing protein [Microseira wollei]GET40462.1 hypothetical protein MiSe_52710 [Microseira wollei NIES-4236]